MENPILAEEGARGSRRRMPLSVGALVAVAAAAAWAGYRMLDPVAGYGQSDLTCHSTAAPGAGPGFTTTPWIEVKPGHSLQVRTLTLVDSVNYALAGTGIQHDGMRLGPREYPAGDGDPRMQAAWLSRTELPATLDDGPDSSLIMALEPIDLNQESSLRAVKIGYSNQWGLSYSIDVGPRFEAKPNCLLDDGEEE